MKKFFVLGIVLILSLGFFGCGGGSSGGDTYWTRGFLITEGNADTVLSNNGLTAETFVYSNTTITFALQQKLYNEAYAARASEREYRTGLSESEIRRRFLDSGFSTSEVDQAMSYLRRQGNIFAWFWGYTGIPSGQLLVYYVEKE